MFRLNLSNHHASCFENNDTKFEHKIRNRTKTKSSMNEKKKKTFIRFNHFKLDYMYIILTLFMTGKQDKRESEMNRFKLLFWDYCYSTFVFY